MLELSFPKIFKAVIVEAKVEDDLRHMIACASDPNSKVEKLEVT